MQRRLCWIFILCSVLKQSFSYTRTFTYRSSLENRAEYIKSVAKICEDDHEEDCKSCERLVFWPVGGTKLFLKDFSLDQFNDLETFNHVKDITLDGVTFRQLTKNPSEMVAHLHKLTLIDNQFNFARNKLPIFEQLFELKISRNNFVEVHEDWFETERFPGLETLDLSSNGMRQFKRQEIKLLKSLYLSNNEIESFEEGVFDKMPALKMIDLHGNPLKSGLTFKRFTMPKNKENRFLCQCDYELKTANGWRADSIGNFVCDHKRGCIGCNGKNKVYFSQFGQPISKMYDMSSLDEFCPMRVQGSSHRLSVFESLKRTKVLEILILAVFVVLCAFTFSKKNYEFRNMDTFVQVYTALAVLLALGWTAWTFKGKAGMRGMEEHLIVVIRDLTKVANVMFALLLPLVVLLMTVRFEHKVLGRRYYRWAVVAFVFALIVACSY